MPPDSGRRRDRRGLPKGDPLCFCSLIRQVTCLAFFQVKAVFYFLNFQFFTRQNGNPKGSRPYPPITRDISRNIFIITFNEIRLQFLWHPFIVTDVQHSVILTASPPNDVSLNFSDISSPVCFMAAIQLSKGIKC